MDYKITTPKDREVIKSVIDKLPEGKRYDVSVKLHRERRTLDQNRLYFLWLACISDETGQSKDDLHDYFKQAYLGFSRRSVIVGSVEQQVYVSPTTTALNTKQFTDYLNQIQVFANAELGILLPNPTDIEFEQFYNKYKDAI